MSHTIQIRIGKGGKTSVTVSGVKGAGCKALTQEFEKLLGDPGEAQETGEYFEQPNIQIQNQ